MQTSKKSIYTCKVEIVLNVPAAGLPELTEVNFDLRIPEPGNLDPDKYVSDKMEPTAAGVKLIANAFVQGLVANVRLAQKTGLWDAQKHLDWISNEVARSLEVQPESIHHSNFRTNEKS